MNSAWRNPTHDLLDHKIDVLIELASYFAAKNTNHSIKLKIWDHRVDQGFTAAVESFFIFLLAPTTSVVQQLQCAQA